MTVSDLLDGANRIMSQVDLRDGAHQTAILASLSVGLFSAAIVYTLTPDAIVNPQIRQLSVPLLISFIWGILTFLTLSGAPHKQLLKMSGNTAVAVSGLQLILMHILDSKSLLRHFSGQASILLWVFTTATFLTVGIAYIVRQIVPQNDPFRTTEEIHAEVLDDPEDVFAENGNDSD